MAKGRTDSEPRENKNAPELRGDEGRAEPEFLKSCWPEYSGRLSGYFWRRGVARGALDDLVQETFARMLHAVRKGGLERHRVPGWIFGTARHLAADYHRDRKRGRRFESYIEDNLPARPLRSEAERRRRLELIWAAIAELPLDLRTPLELYVKKERSYQAIADQFGITPNAVGLRLYRAREILRRRFRPERPGPE